MKKTRLSRGAVAAGDAATFPVILVLSNTDLDIHPGMTGRAEIQREELTFGYHRFIRTTG